MHKNKIIKVLKEEYDFINGCVKEMEEKPDVYCKLDHICLPIQKKWLEGIFKKCGLCKNGEKDD